MTSLHLYRARHPIPDDDPVFTPSEHRSAAIAAAGTLMFVVGLLCWGAVSLARWVVA